MSILRIPVWILACAFLAYSVSAHAVGAAGDTPWPAQATVNLGLTLGATLDGEGRPVVRGELVVSNPSDTALTIQDATNRLVLAFLVFDTLGNPVAPQGTAKVDPAFATRTLGSRGTYTHPLDTLDFVTGSIQQSYLFKCGQTYRVIAVYRPAGPNGPGFTSQEVALRIPE